MQTLFEGWRGFLLLEGRKENAALALVKKINDPFLKDFLNSVATNPDHTGSPTLARIDPTPNKKYIEWVARRINDYARKEEDDNYLQRLANAERDPEAMIPGGPGDKAYTPGRLELIKSYTPEQRLQGGYITNAEKNQRDRDDAKVNIINIINKINRNLGKYHRFAERGLMDKNIDKYKEIHEWEHEVYKAEKEERERDRMKAIEAGAKETTDYIHDDDNFMIVRPRTADSSCYYGQGTRWCISASESRNYFDQYTGEGTGFYFVMFKHLPQDDVYKKMALVYTVGDSEEPNEVFDAADDEVGVDAVREAVEENILAGALKSVLGTEIKKLKGDLRQKYFKQRLESVQAIYKDLEDLLMEKTWGYVWSAASSRGSLKKLKVVLNKLGLDDESLAVAEYDDIQEHISELIDEQHYEILGHANSHFEDNPAGPTHEDYQKVLDQYDLQYVYAQFDEYDENRMYWDGGFSVSFTDIHDDLEDADAESVENVFRQILDDYHIYPDEIETYHGDMNVRMQPDYDENEGVNGFESFMSRMQDVDNSLQKIFGEDSADVLNTFKEAGLLAGIAVKTLKERFDDLELENFEIDIEEQELSIYARLDITVPIPQHLYRGLTAGAAEWTTGNRADISKSPALQAYDAMLKQRATDHSDQLIQHLENTFDKVFEMYANKLQSALPGFERSPVARETTGLLIPDYNVGLYRTAHKTQVGPSGLLTPYFFDVRIEADEEESTEEAHLKLIELFLKTIDRGEMIKKIKDRLEVIVQNDAIKNVMPEFEEGGEAPEIDPRSGKVLSAAEREEQAREQLQGLAGSEIGTTAQGPISENRKRLKILIKENVPFGGLNSFGSFGTLPGAGPGVPQLWPNDDPGGLGSDLEKVAKAVLSRNGKVLLLKNKKGWDLPGGHLKQGEDIVSGLRREVYEETGLIISDITSLGASYKNKQFFCASFPRDDIRLSDEHSEFVFAPIDKIQGLEGLAPYYKKAVMKCVDPERLRESKTSKIKIVIG